MPLETFINPKFNLKFLDLYERNGLQKVNQYFELFLEEKNLQLAKDFAKIKENKQEDSEVLIEVAKVFEQFLVELFLIEKADQNLKKKHQDLAIIYQIKRDFVQRQIAKKYNENSLDKNFSGKEILEKLQIKYDNIDDLEVELARKIDREENLEELEKYAIWALFFDEGKIFHQDGALFILPKKIDYQNLVQKNFQTKERHDFNLCDNGFALNRSLAEANYCIFCHKQNKDSCKTGLKDKETNQVKTNPLGVELLGCPMDEKISEMNFLKSQAFSIGALAIAMVDNPLIASTGHRICNDCMKSCIYQKQDAVDIPQVETRILKDVLALPYGFEIYGLLTRFNPLNIKNNLPKESSGKKILVCGLGPAGFSLSHYLLQLGHEVVAIDGLKIEPLNCDISGIDEFKNRTNFKPIKYLDEIYESLNSRQIGGFGGVAEYGITARWDKNFLKIIRLTLERRKNFTMFGGLRFGSSINDLQAFNHYNFDHIALCLGAGRPNIIDLKNNFAKGVRMASDFLMSLQLTGSFKEELFTNLQIRAPIIVIGGGLTATDTACEANLYYIVQIRKFADKIAKIGKEKVWKILNEEEKIIAEEFLNHFEIYNKNGIKALFDKIGKTKILYRKSLIESPAYKLNHQEINQALAQGIEFVENITPKEVIIDKFNHIKSLKCLNNEKNELEFSCGSLLVGAGTSPNISAVLEDNLNFKLSGKYFSQIKENSFITKIDEETNKSVSFLGDLHPNFEGNVVKALASGKMASIEIDENLQRVKSVSVNNFEKKIINDFLVKIKEIKRLSDYVVEISIHAPLLAKASQIGHIFRLQNYHFFAKEISGQRLALEGIAVTAVGIDKEKGIINGIVVETGGSTSLIQNFKENEPCIFMGPSGTPTEFSQNETVILIGGGRGNQVLTKLAKIFKSNNCKVLFFAGYKDEKFIVLENEMIANSCELILAIEETNDKKYFNGTIIEALKDYFEKNPTKIDRIFTIGNNKMMHEIAKIKHQNLIPSFGKAKIAIASLNSPMQCMMKGVCSQCLQRKMNDEGKEEYFYSCSKQDQDMERFDFDFLHNRCEQNSLSEKVSKMWLSLSLKNY